MLCRNGLLGFDEVFCYGAYEGTLRKLIHLFKYSGMRRLAHPLGALLADALPRDRQFDLVTAVPLHWRRRWQRGFNQSELLGKAIARARGIPAKHVLRRGWVADIARRRRDDHGRYGRRLRAGAEESRSEVGFAAGAGARRPKIYGSGGLRQGKGACLNDQFEQIAKTGSGFKCEL